MNIRKPRRGATDAASTPLFRPFRASGIFSQAYPGLCRGLECSAPSGQEVLENSPQSGAVQLTMPLDPQRAQAVFLLALEASGPDERRRRLDAECVGNAELRERVEALLAAHDATRGFGDQPSAAPCGNIPGPTCERAGTILAGRFKLLEPIGEGGMGSVWVAEQTQPVRRKVAVKFVKAGMDSRQVLARFEAERQALALMDHPNIARVLVPNKGDRFS